MTTRSPAPDVALAGAVLHHRLDGSGSSPAEVADAVVGLHNTSPVSPHLSLRARIPGFGRRDLDAAMWEGWELVRFRAMRLTMFVFTRPLLEVAAAATRDLHRGLAERWLRDSGLDQAAFDRLATQVLSALEDGPLTSRALRQRLGVPQAVDLPGVVSRLCDLGVLVGGAPPRSWRSPIRVYHRWGDVVSDVDLGRWEPDAAVAELIRRYVAAYGPVTINDMAWWTGLAKATCRSALERLGGVVEEVTVPGWAGPLYREADQPKRSLPDHVSALPLLDPYVQGYRDRIRFLDADRHDYVYDGGGNSTATIVSAGRIVGVWQTSDDPVESVRYHLFAGGPSSVRSAAEAELAAVGVMYFDREVDVVEVREMTPLSAGGGRSAAHPLDGTVHRASRRGGGG